MYSSGDRGYHDGYGHVGREERYERVARSSSGHKFLGSATEGPSSGDASQHLYSQPSVVDTATAGPRHVPHSQGSHAQSQHQRKTASLSDPLPISLTSSSPSTAPKSSSASIAWGELDSEATSSEVQQAVKPLWVGSWRPESLRCSVPRLHSCPASSGTASESHTPTLSVSSTLDHPCNASGHNLVLHCLDLQQHIKEIKSITSVATVMPTDHTAELPPMPALEPEGLGRGFVVGRLLGPPKEHLPLVKLDSSTLYLLQRKSVAAISNYAGYEAASSHALDTFNSVLGEFLNKLCQLLRVNSDLRAECRSGSFEDVLESSLHQCGIGGKAALHEYWTSDVKARSLFLHQEALECRTEHSRVMELHSGSTDVMKSSTLASLPIVGRSRQESGDFTEPLPWMSGTPMDFDGVDEELLLETIMEQANIENVLPTKTPDVGGPVFPPFPDMPSQEGDVFTPLNLDGPPRKRLRTVSLTND